MRSQHGARARRARATRARRARRRRGSTRPSGSRAPSISRWSQRGIVPLGDIRPATFIGKGKVEEIAGARRRADEAGVVVMDCALSPVQQRNLEKAWNAKVLDRTGLILEIFGRRARTTRRRAAGRARASHLSEKPAGALLDPSRAPARRLRLSRRPGETQIEADRRHDRGAHRAHRSANSKGQAHAQAASREPQARAVSDRGAGRLHQCRQVDAVQPADAARACCRPTCCSRRSIRRCARSICRTARAIILSDTVGFISDLPTMLVAAFRATLEEVIEADVILHVRDMSHDEAEAQSHDVEKVLGELGIELGDARTARSLEQDRPAEPTRKARAPFQPGRAPAESTLPASVCQH